MKRFIFPIILLVFFIIGCNNPVNQDNNALIVSPADFVNPFVGTDAHGHTYPGASVPFGMVQLSPDTRLEGWDGCSGFHYSDSVLFGFSHTALSGTGVPDYSDILFMPTVGEIRLYNGSDDVDKGYASRFSHEREWAEAGYYSVHLDDYGIDVGLTASKRTGFHQYTYAGGGPANIIIDLYHRDKVVDSWLRQVGPNKVEGYRRSTAWAADQHLYFAAEFSKPFTSYGLSLDDQISETDFIRGENVKGVFQFDLPDDRTIQVKVALSAVSSEGAWKNLEAELPGWDFDAARREARPREQPDKRASP